MENLRGLIKELLKKEQYNTYNKLYLGVLEISEKYDIDKTLIVYANEGRALNKIANRKTNKLRPDKLKAYVDACGLMLENVKNIENHSSFVGITEDEYKINFFTRLRVELKKKVVGMKGTEKNSRSYFSNSKKIREDDVDEFISAFPQILSSIACKDMFNHNAVYNLINVSDLTSFNHNNLNSKFVSHKLISDFKGIFLGHTLSPYPDNITLLCELGRLKRVEEIFKLKATIILTDVQWAKINRGVQILQENGFSEESITESLNECFHNRKKMYGLLGFSEKKNNFKILDNKPNSSYTQFRNLDEATFKKDIKDFSKLGLKIEEIAKSSDFKGYTVESIIERLRNKSNDVLNKVEKIDVLKFLTYSKQLVGDNKILDVLNVIFGSHKNFSQQTFEYVFLQRYAQHFYSDYLKIGGKPEYNFDLTYSYLDSFDNLKEHNMNSLYFEQYCFEKGNNVIPYYFPSLSLMNNNKKIDEIENNIIFISDYKNDEKIENIINKMSLSQIAIQLSDLLSFCIYFFRNKQSFWDSLINFTQRFDKNLSRSILNEIKKGEENGLDKEYLNHFGNIALDITYDKNHMPYYYYPYAIAIYANDKKNMKLTAKYRRYYANFLIYTLTQIQEIMKSPHLKPKKNK